MNELRTKEERRYQFFWGLFFVLVSIIAFVPILRVVSISFSSKSAILKGSVSILPVGFNIDAYKKVLSIGSFINSFGYSVLLMAASVVINMIMTILLAYPLSRKGLKGTGIITVFCVITMYLNPGTIPHYFNVRDFGLIDSVWALLIPGAMSVYNMIIMRTAFRSIDDSLYEAARIDGCTEFGIMYKIAVPLCVPTIATLALFYAVSRWNGIEDQMYYINTSSLNTVQMTLKQMIESVTVQVEEGQTTELIADNIKSAGIALSMTPMLIVYPFIQRYFTQGIMLGAVKG
jgi:putative aldouronate transport system permease protein